MRLPPVAAGLLLCGLAFPTHAQDRSPDATSASGDATSPQPLAPPAPAASVAETSSAARALALDKVYGIKGMDNPYFSFGETLTQDAGHWRSDLADAGFGFIEANSQIFATDLHDTRAPGKPQSYWGQKPSIYNINFFYLTYDTGKLGVPGGQLQASLVNNRSSFVPYQPNLFSVNRLAYFQSFAGGRVELLVGIVNNGQDFVGTALGGNSFSPFGPAASIPYEVGLSAAPGSAPTIMIKNNIGKHFYNQFAVQRSLPPAPNVFDANADLNPSGLKFRIAGARALLIDEVGYKQAAAPGKPYTWVRIGGIYNKSRFDSYEVLGEKRSNRAFYALFDRQVWQIGDTDKSAYRGLYLGGSAMAAPERVNAVARYWELRAYGKGLFDARPKDQVALVVNHQSFSRYLVATNAAEALATDSGARSHDSSLTITPSYTAFVTHGVYATVGLSFTNHPKQLTSPGEDSSRLLLLSLFTAF